MRNKRYGRGFAGNGRKHPKPSYFPIVLILCLSVGCGYATAKYVVDPVVNYVPQIEKKVSEKQADKAAEKKKETFSAAKETTRMIEDDVKVKTAGKVCGYAVQLGCYSDQASAEKARESGRSGRHIKSWSKETCTRLSGRSVKAKKMLAVRWQNFRKERKDSLQKCTNSFFP